jgi:integrase/recombinase XerD
MGRDLGTWGRALDAFLAETSRQGRTFRTTGKYNEVLTELANYSEARGIGPTEVTLDHLRSWFDTYAVTRPPRRGTKTPRPPVSASTTALYVSVVKGFFSFLVGEEAIATSPAERLVRPRRPRPEDIEVVSTSADDVRAMIAACASWDELLCISTLALTGSRRNAAAQVRRADLDMTAGMIRLHEKGGKTITKPVPDELLAIYRAAEASGVWISGEDYLIPNRRQPKRTLRSNKLVYKLVKEIAGRARVRATPHSLRAAFATLFADTNPDQLLALRDLLGHARVETTMIYLRRRAKARAMETVRGLSWTPAVETVGKVAIEQVKEWLDAQPIRLHLSASEPSADSVFGSSAVMPPTGFEPVRRP